MPSPPAGIIARPPTFQRTRPLKMPKNCSETVEIAKKKLKNRKYCSRHCVGSLDFGIPGFGISVLGECQCGFSFSLEPLPSEPLFWNSLGRSPCCGNSHFGSFSRFQAPLNQTPLGLPSKTKALFLLVLPFGVWIVGRGTGRGLLKSSRVKVLVPPPPPPYLYPCTPK